MTADSTPDQQQTASLNPLAVRDRLHRQFAMLGIPINVATAMLGPHPVVGFSSLWVPDAHKLAEALDKIPELKPYIKRAPVAAKEEVTTR